MFSDLDLIEPHPLWQLEQGSSFHQDLTLSKKTVCERFFWERLYHLAISSSKRGVSPQSGQQPTSRSYTLLVKDELARPPVIGKDIFSLGIAHPQALLTQQKSSVFVESGKALPQKTSP